MLSQENLDKLIELKVFTPEELAVLGDDDILQIVIERLYYYEDLITPGVLNLANRYKRLSTEKIAYKDKITAQRCKELYEQWGSYTAVAEYLGVSVNTVKSRIKDAGILEKIESYNK